MARYPRIREQHIAVFGESGSGKTVLASSFYGPSQEKPSASEIWDLVADDTSLGSRLYRNYVGMRDYATTPATTRFAATTYYFSVKLKGGDTKTRTRPFDILRLAWHDYPGEWFEESPSSAEEATGGSTRFAPCCDPTSRSCSWTGRSYSTTRVRRRVTSGPFSRTFVKAFSN